NPFDPLPNFLHTQIYCTITNRIQRKSLWDYEPYSPKGEGWGFVRAECPYFIVWLMRVSFFFVLSVAGGAGKFLHEFAFWVMNNS
ncbi:MAG: hypothetical protein KDD28_30945, partial [Phaeodactylibacter sp.]|nr:hypothetical protein [Phaeodactylibacter sp.]